MWRDFARRIALPWLAYGFFGWWAGTKLVAIHQFQVFKVLNIVGITFDLAGVSILSGFVSESRKYQAFVSGPLAEQFVGFSTASCIGLILCYHFGPGGPSKALLETFSYGAFFYLILPITFFMTSFVSGSEGQPTWSEAKRAQVFGGFFLVGGIILQLYAAILDLYS